MLETNSQDFIKKSGGRINLEKRDVLSLGIGLGQDYGGIGGNLIMYPQQNIGIFTGVGYAIAGTGYNFGVKLRLINEKSSVAPYLIAMYGYNAALAVLNKSDLNKIFYGPTVGIGLDIGLKPNKAGYWSLGIYYPIRGNEVDNYINFLKTNYLLEMKNSLWPISISIGYKIKII
jgi:hypothetical protein